MAHGNAQLAPLMPTLAITIPGRPYGKPSVARTRDGQRYTPKEVKDYYRAVAWLVADAWRGAGVVLPMVAPVVSIVALMPRPQKKPKGYPLIWTEGRNPCLTAPDNDNVCKIVLDSLTGANVWRDDRLVSGLTCLKLYAGAGEEPATLVHISDLVTLDAG